MLTIRKQQMAVLEARLARQFRIGLRRHVREELEAEAKDITDSELDQMIQQAVERGRSYEVTAERDVSLFLDLMILKGRDFDRDPKFLWARKILVDKELDGAAKMKAIYGRLAVLENRNALPEETG